MSRAWVTSPSGRTMMNLQLNHWIWVRQEKPNLQISRLILYNVLDSLTCAFYSVWVFIFRKHLCPWFSLSAIHCFSVLFSAFLVPSVDSLYSEHPSGLSVWEVCWGREGFGWGLIRGWGLDCDCTERVQDHVCEHVVYSAVAKGWTLAVCYRVPYNMNLHNVETQ